MELNLKMENQLRASIVSTIKALTPEEKQSLTNAFANFNVPKVEEKKDDCSCEICEKIIKVESDYYDYDDDTGFYRCGDCMRDDDGYEEYTNDFRCGMCEGYFQAGKDFCKNCGFDLNSFNVPKVEEDSDDE